MTQAPPQYGMMQTAPPPPPARRTSGLAIASLICSLIFCCPGLALIGILLGLIALGPTGRPGVSGRGLAIGGILIGLLVTLGQAGTVFALFKGGKFVMGKLMEPAEQLVGDYNSGRDKALYDRTSPEFQQSVDYAQFEAYMARAREEYGQAEIMGLWETIRSGQSANVNQTGKGMVANLPLRFEKVGVKTVSLVYASQAGQLRLTKVEIEGLGVLTSKDEAQLVETAVGRSSHSDWDD